MALAYDHVEDALRVLVQAGTELVVPVLYEAVPGDGRRLLTYLLGWFGRMAIPVVDPLWVREGRWGLVLDPSGARPTLADGDEVGDGDDVGGLDSLDDIEALLGCSGAGLPDDWARTQPCWAESDDDPTSPAGAPLPDPSRVASVADFVGLGFAPAASRARLADLVTPRAGDPRPDLVARSVRARLARRGAPVVPRHATLAAWRRLLAGAATPQAEARLQAVAPTPSDIAAMAASLTHPEWRDGMIAWLCPDTLPLAALLPEVADAVRRLPRPTGMARPDAPALTAVRRLEAALQCLCQALPDQCGAAAAATLTVTAHVAWWRGDGTVARVCLERALRVEPGYRLAQLLQSMVDHGLSTRSPDGLAGTAAQSWDEAGRRLWGRSDGERGLDASA